MPNKEELKLAFVEFAEALGHEVFVDTSSQKDIHQREAHGEHLQRTINAIVDAICTEG